MKITDLFDIKSNIIISVTNLCSSVLENQSHYGKRLTPLIHYSMIIIAEVVEISIS